MGWLWLVGSIQLQVSFAKEPYKRDDILQKRRIISSILLTVATPQQQTATHCNTLQHAAISLRALTLKIVFFWRLFSVLLSMCAVHEWATTQCNAMQPTATHSNTLQRDYTRGYSRIVNGTARQLHSTRMGCNALQRTATHCNMTTHADFWELVTVPIGICEVHQRAEK